MAGTTYRRFRRKGQVTGRDQSAPLLRSHSSVRVTLPWLDQFLRSLPVQTVQVNCTHRSSSSELESSLMAWTTHRSVQVERTRGAPCLPSVRSCTHRAFSPAMTGMDVVGCLVLSFSLPPM